MKGANLSLSLCNTEQLNAGNSIWQTSLKIHSKYIERIIFSKSVNKILATVPGKKTDLIW